jgi:hypothetical protein
MQDVLYLHKQRTQGISWREDGFVGSLLECLQLCPEQLDTMERANILNDEMRRKDVNLQELRKKWDKLISSIQHTKGYVPSQFLFCSGSIYGIQNYMGFLKTNNLSQNAVNKQRELILQEIILNTQRTINVLIEDMGYLAERTEQAIGEGKDLEERWKKLQSRLQAAMQAKTSEQKEWENRKDPSYEGQEGRAKENSTFI